MGSICLPKMPAYECFNFSVEAALVNESFTVGLAVVNAAYLVSIFFKLLRHIAA